MLAAHSNHFTPTANTWSNGRQYILLWLSSLFLMDCSSSTFEEFLIVSASGMMTAVWLHWWVSYIDTVNDLVFRRIINWLLFVWKRALTSFIYKLRLVGYAFSDNIIDIDFSLISAWSIQSVTIVLAYKGSSIFSIVCGF